MRKKDMVAIILAGEKDRGLGVLTANKPKPAVSFGGKYRIIDFPLSNCINSGIDSLGVLTRSMWDDLGRHIGTGAPWDLDRRFGGITILTPYAKNGDVGTAEAIFQNIDYLDQYEPQHVLVLIGSHVYKMDYSHMLDFHKANGCDVTVASISKQGNNIDPGIYIFSYDILRDALERVEKLYNDPCLTTHVLPMLAEEDKHIISYPFTGYFRNIATIQGYWAANMDLTRPRPKLDLYEASHKIYTFEDHHPPMYTGPNAKIVSSLVGEGSEIMGSVLNSVVGSGVVVDEDATVTNSVIMGNCYIGKGTIIDHCIIDTGCIIGDSVTIVIGEEEPSGQTITVVGEHSVLPDNVKVGQNCTIHGKTAPADYLDQVLESGHSILKGESDGDVVGVPGQ